MARLIAFVFCIAVLFFFGGWTRTGMAIGAVTVLALAGYAIALLVGMFLSPDRKR